MWLDKAITTRTDKKQRDRTYVALIHALDGLLALHIDSNHARQQRPAFFNLQHG